jgi:hypothetical protein
MRQAEDTSEAVAWVFVGAFPNLNRPKFAAAAFWAERRCHSPAVQRLIPRTLIGVSVRSQRSPDGSGGVRSRISFGTTGSA